MGQLLLSTIHYPLSTNMSKITGVQSIVSALISDVETQSL